MVKKYTRVNDTQRKELVRLIHQQRFTIRAASRATGISYPNAKAINATYIQEGRVSKKTFRFRLKTVDKGHEVWRNVLPSEKFDLYDRCADEDLRKTCGIRPLKRGIAKPSITVSLPEGRLAPGKGPRNVWASNPLQY